MIQEVFNPLIERFKDADADEELFLGFSPKIDETMLFHRLSKGWWHSFFFGTNEKYHLWGLRIFPTLPYSQWPAIKDYTAQSVWTVAPNFAAFPAMMKQEDFRLASLFDEYPKIWDQVTATLNSFYEIAGGSQYHPFLTNYVMDKDNAPNRGVPDLSYTPRHHNL